MHIAPTPFFSDRGCHIRIEGIVRSLSELGFQNTVCTYHHGREVATVQTIRIKAIKNYTQTEAGPSKYKLWADWRLLWLCLKQYRKSKPAVIHAHLHEGLLIGWLVKTVFFWRKTPLLADMQGSLTGELSEHGSFAGKDWLRRLSGWFERVLMRMPDQIICSSPQSQELLALAFGLPVEDIVLVQDGADAVQALSNDQRSELKQKLSLPANKVIAVYSGALLEGKGLPALKEVLLACKDEPHIHFLIIGYPVENLHPFLVQNDLDERCTLTGRVAFEVLPAHLALAAVALEPKNSGAGEGSGKLLNYLAAGLPVIAFDNRNNADFLPAGAPLAVNVEQFTAQLQLLAQDAGLRGDLGANNRLHFEQNYSWGTTRKQLKVAYDALLERS